MKREDAKAIENATNALNSAMERLPEEYGNLTNLIASFNEAIREGEALDDIAGSIRSSADRISVIASEIRTFEKRLRYKYRVR